MSSRPCRRPIAITSGRWPDNTCPYPRMKGKQRCVWHWLMAQSSDVQAAQAGQRYKNNVVGPDQEIARVPSDDWPSGERWCAGCQSFVPLFYVSGSRCKACASSAAHARRVETTYGISAEEYTRLYKLQGGRCAICRNKSRTIRFAVDHDHQTGEVRGLLCKRCNHDLLGGGHDDVKLLFRAIEYLLFPPAQNDFRRPRHAVLARLERRLELTDTLAAPKLSEREPPPF